MSNFENTSKLTKIGVLGTGAQVSDVYTEHTQGRMEKTGNPLDFAINGEGFFVIQTKTGFKVTRDGGFTVDTEGYLINQNGDRVLGQSADGRFGDVKTKKGAFFGKSDNMLFEKLLTFP